MEVTKAKKRRSWDRPQDNELLNCIIELGPRSWEDLAVKISGRTGKQCRERWINQLNPLVKKVAYTKEENWLLLIQNIKQHNTWAKIASHLPGRTDNSIKNQWNVVFKGRTDIPMQQLEKYIQKVAQLDGISDVEAARPMIYHRLAQYLQYRTQELYLEYIEFRLNQLKNKQIMDPDNKLTNFRVRVLECALCRSSSNKAIVTYHSKFPSAIQS